MVPQIEASRLKRKTLKRRECRPEVRRRLHDRAFLRAGARRRVGDFRRGLVPGATLWRFLAPGFLAPGLAPDLALDLGPDLAAGFALRHTPLMLYAPTEHLS